MYLQKYKIQRIHKYVFSSLVCICLTRLSWFKRTFYLYLKGIYFINKYQLLFSLDQKSYITVISIKNKTLKKFVVSQMTK